MTVFRFIAPALAVLFLAGCYTTPRETAGTWPEPVVRQETAHMALALDSHSGQLYWGGQMSQLALFADEFRSRGHGPLVLSFPEGSANAEGAVAALGEARAFLTDRGVDPRSIVQASYDARGQASAPLTVSFVRYVAEIPPECAQMAWSNLAFEADNRAHPRFGCWRAANMAAMIGDPYHLVGPTATGAPDPGRRQTVMDTYRRGEPTATPRSDDERVRVSD